MYSGLALLMDVYYPDSPNGAGVIAIPGSGWQSELGYGARPLKDHPLWGAFVQPIVAAGYTVFVPSHRAAPTFHYPAAVEDVQRAVRFIRHRAKEFGIDPGRLGAVGHSSGGHLALMLGVLDGSGNPDDADPVNRLGGRVQAVVAVAAPADLARFGSSLGAPYVATFVGAVQLSPGGVFHSPGTIEWKLYHDASPISWVSAGDAPTLLIHGEKDNVVPVRQAEHMFEVLRAAQVEARLIRVPGGGHVWDESWEGFPNAMVEWLDRFLKD